MRPQPCEIPRRELPPDLPGAREGSIEDQPYVAMPAAEFYALASWVVYQIKRDDAVATCPWVRESPLPDIPRSLSGGSSGGKGATE